MKLTKKIMLYVSTLLGVASYLDASTNHKNGAHTLSAGTSRKSSSTQSATTSSQGSLQQLSQEAQKLMQEFQSAVNAIPEKSKKGQKDNHKEYKNAVEKAYEAYKKIYEYAKSHALNLSKGQEQSMNKAVVKLFNCKNIKNMVWKQALKHGASK